MFNCVHMVATFPQALYAASMKYNMHTISLYQWERWGTQTLTQCNISS